MGCVKSGYEKSLWRNQAVIILFLVYNLDKIAIAATKKWNANKAFKSCDAFYENNGNHYYIEFKNQPLNNIITDEIQQKAFNSLCNV